jgi:hypothetical protein
MSWTSRLPERRGVAEAFEATTCMPSLPPPIHLTSQVVTRTMLTICCVASGCHASSNDSGTSSLGRGGERVSEGLQHNMVRVAIVELLQVCLHLRHLGRQEPERWHPAVRKSSRGSMQSSLSEKHMRKEISPMGGRRESQLAEQ